ncbi:MAG TPA: Rv3235 family protein, partial [Nocardioidaceae bacterium]|nr:Rv3235 family protein [Nocardioidaceae bacterium]
GDRPLAQLLRWTSQRVYVEIERRLSILNRTTDAGRRMRTVRPQVRSVHVFHPTPVSAEVSVHVRHGQRSRAIAARLEQRKGRWQCTALQLG